MYEPGQSREVKIPGVGIDQIVKTYATVEFAGYGDGEGGVTGEWMQVSVGGQISRAKTDGTTGADVARFVLLILAFLLVLLLLSRRISRSTP